MSSTHDTERALIARVLRCRYPVCTTIDPSGYRWDMSRLNEVIDEESERDASSSCLKIPQGRAAPATLPESLHREQRLKFAQVQALTGMGRTWTYSAIKDDRFPPPQRDGPRCSRWRAGDVLDWLESNRERQRKAAPEAADKLLVVIAALREAGLTSLDDFVHAMEFGHAAQQG